MPKEIKSLEEFEQNILFDGLTVIHFWAEWNLYDKTLSKILKEIECEFKDKVNICSLDVEQELLIDFLKNLPIINLPTLGYYTKGNKISLEIGLRKKDEIREKLGNLLNIKQ